MPNRNYVKGRALEYDVVNALRKKGYYAIRSAGSHTAIDVIAWDSNRRFAVQCKSGSSQMTEISERKLIEMARALSAFPILVERKNRKTYWQLLGVNHFSDIVRVPYTVIKSGYVGA